MRAQGILLHLLLSVKTQFIDLLHNALSECLNLSKKPQHLRATDTRTSIWQSSGSVPKRGRLLVQKRCR